MRVGEREREREGDRGETEEEVFLIVSPLF